MLPSARSRLSSMAPRVREGRRTARLGEVLFLLCLAAAPDATRAQETAALQRVVDSLEARGFSGVVLVGDLRASGADGIRFERAIGLADRERRQPMRADARWRWASVTKQVTAALVLREVDAGRVALDAPVARYLPAFPHGRVTVRQLLQHRSGLADPEDTPRDAEGIPAYYRTNVAVDADAVHRRALDGVCAGTPRAPAGERVAYNNCDYLVLGALLERLGGRSYPALVRDALADSLALRSLAAEPAGEVTGYLAGGAREPAIALAAYGAAGALHGTARDLLAFDRLLFTHRLVSPTMTAEMWNGEPRFGYVALGAWSFEAPLAGCAAPVRLVERRGAILGVQVRNVIAPALGRAVIVFTNDAGAEFGEVWQGRGLTHALLSRALCSGA